MNERDWTPDPGAAWARASFCGTNACVEVARTVGGVFVRDGKDPDGPALWFSDSEFADFEAGVKAGEFE